MNVRNVPTFSHHTGSGAETFDEAEAIVFTSFTSGCIRIFSYTIGMKTSKALLFTFETTAEMTARQNFLATIVHPLNAVSWTAHLFESRDHGWRCLCQFAVTEPALFHFFVFFMLIASFAGMIRLSLTLWICAEYFSAISKRTTNSKFRHTFSSLSSDWLSTIIFLI